VAGPILDIPDWQGIAPARFVLQVAAFYGVLNLTNPGLVIPGPPGQQIYLKELDWHTYSSITINSVIQFSDTAGKAYYSAVFQNSGSGGTDLTGIVLPVGLGLQQTGGDLGNHVTASFNLKYYIA
jgi:hypothetical protein